MSDEENPMESGRLAMINNETSGNFHDMGIERIGAHQEEEYSGIRNIVESEELQKDYEDPMEYKEIERRGERWKKNTEKGMSYQISLLEGKRDNLIRKIIKKQSIIEDLLYSDKNLITVREELNLFNDIFKMLCAVHEEVCSIKQDFTGEDWFTIIDDKVCSFKRKIQNWLRESEQREKASSKSSKASSKASSRSKMSSRASTKQRVIDEKLKVAELLAQQSFREKRRAAEEASEKLRIEEEVAKATAKLKILENQEWSETKEGYSCISGKLIDFPKKETAARKEMNNVDMKYPEDARYIDDQVWPLNLNTYEVENYLRETQLKEKQSREQPKRKLVFAEPNKNTRVSSLPKTTEAASIEDYPMRGTDQLICKLLKQQSAPDVEIEPFDGNPLNFNYFMSVFYDVVEQNIDDPRSKLIRLIKYTTGEAKELVKNCINLPSSVGYENAIKLLKKRYGDPHQLLSAYRKEIQNWPSLKIGDSYAFRKFFNFIIKFQSISENTKWNIGSAPDIICMLVTKLPSGLQHGWNKKVYKLRMEQSREPNLADLVSFVDEATTLASDPLFSKEGLSNYMTSKQQHQETRKRNFKTLATTTDDQDKSNKSSCGLCHESHDIEECGKYLQLNVSERSKMIFRKRLCYACLKPISSSHTANNCKRRKTCKVCKERHPTSLHGLKSKEKSQNSHQKDEIKSLGIKSDNEREDTEPTKDKQLTNNLACSSTNIGSMVVSLCIVPVQVRHSNGKRIINTHALLDSCSQGTFITEALMNEIDVYGKSTSISIKTLNGESSYKSVAVEGLEVSNQSNSIKPQWIKLPKTFSRNILPVNEEDVISTEQLNKWDHLARIAPEISEVRSESVGLLIGANCPKALEPIEVVPARNNGPYAFRTVLGWCVVGPVAQNSNMSKLSCNRIAIREIGGAEIGNHFFEFKTKVKENDIVEMFEKMYQFDITEQSLPNNQSDMEVQYSVEDQRFIRLLDKETKLIDAHYEVPLPFKDGNTKFPNNRVQALKRMEHSKRRFLKNENFFQDYKAFMEKMIKNGYAERSFGKDIDGTSWYIPHHGVYHPHKPDKFRVVFDCGAEYHGTSLNKSLMSGPDLTNQLVGVLMRFREESVAFTSDIEAMFYQVKIPPTQRSFVKFLWWEEGNLAGDIVDYQMCVHVFGATSSPSCSNYALRRTAQDNQHIYGIEASNTLLNNFYVDDLLKSVGSSNEAINLIMATKRMCGEGGFNLTKFASNDQRVLQFLKKINIKADDKVVKKMESFDEKALGIHWRVQDDTFGFDLTLKEKPMTRRGILSTVSSIYDPLGLISPIILKGKLILQQLCKERFSWDDEVSEGMKDLFNKWRSQLKRIDEIIIPRCYKPKIFGKVIECSLHHFSDASEEAYGQASYLRLVNETGAVHCALVMGKSRVAPSKFLSIPRLELMAAVLSIKVSQLIKKQMEMSSYPKISEFFWTDSQVVLGYIKNEAKRFKVFVANRVQTIRDNSSIDHWRYIKSKENPADLASRGLNMNSNENLEKWFNGPKFLWENESNWKICNNDIFGITQGDVEVKKEMTVHVSLFSDDNIICKISRQSGNWIKMKKVLAWILLYIYKLKERVKRKNQSQPVNEDIQPYLNTSLMEAAKEHLIKMVQSEVFHEEMKLLKSNIGNPLKSSSKIYKLDPFIDPKGIIRVGGRLKRSKLNKNFIHPVLLPNKGIITDSIIRWCHENVGHSGRGITLNHIRSCGYWIISGNVAVKRLIFTCVICRKLRGKLGIQKMGDLPVERTQEVPPFTHCGIDVFGQYIIKFKRSDLKRYCVLFTCLSSRAVHIEVINSMDTDSFILSLRRFVARRGNIRTIWSDNGSNFVGAENELRKAFMEMDHDRIKHFMLLHGGDWITWKKNPPYASHMGGVWERQIRTAKSILNGLLLMHSSQLNDESFQTLITEVEAIINSRPLTTNGTDIADSDAPLSPNNLLTLKSNVVFPPPGKFEKPDVYCRKMWRRVQYLADQFWSRWRKEVLSGLQVRHKWNSVKRNYRIGDVVLLKEDCSRNSWPMGVIENVDYGNDGNVRSVQLRLSLKDSNSQKVIKRPISKLVLLVESQ